MAVIPSRWTAGITLELDLDLADYPPGTWSVALALRGPVAIDIEAEALDDIHRLSATADATSAWTPGRYWYTLRATAAGVVREVEAGQLDVLADVAAAGSAYSALTHAQRMLAAVEAVLENRATIEQESYEIGGRSLKRRTIQELMQLRRAYQREVAAERQRTRGVTRCMRPLPARMP